MGRRFGERHILNPALGMIFLPLVMTLASCGTLDTSLDQATEPAQSAVSPESGTVQSIATETVTMMGETREKVESVYGPARSCSSVEAHSDFALCQFDVGAAAAPCLSLNIGA
jgi:hypothetical protein